MKISHVDCHIDDNNFSTGAYLPSMPKNAPRYAVLHIGDLSLYVFTVAGLRRIATAATKGAKELESAQKENKK